MKFWKNPVVRGLFIGWLIFGALFATWLITQDGGTPMPGPLQPGQERPIYNG